MYWTSGKTFGSDYCVCPLRFHNLSDLSLSCVRCVCLRICVCVHGVRREGVRLLRNKEPKKTLTKKQKENQTNETVGNSGAEPFTESPIGREL